MPQRSAAAGVLDSDSKVGVGSSVLLGDAGVEHALVIDDEEVVMPSMNDHIAAACRPTSPAFVSSLTRPPLTSVIC